MQISLINEHLFCKNFVRRSIGQATKSRNVKKKLKFEERLRDFFSWFPNNFPNILRDFFLLDFWYNFPNIFNIISKSCLWMLSFLLIYNIENLILLIFPTTYFWFLNNLLIAVNTKLEIYICARAKWKKGPKTPAFLVFNWNSSLLFT